MRLRGSPVTLGVYPATGLTNRRFGSVDTSSFGSIYLPESMQRFVGVPPTSRVELLEDDNRGAVSAEPVATMDGIPYYLSVKGIGSTIDPFAHRTFHPGSVGELGGGPVPGDAGPAPGAAETRLLTGELWLRGSPYGGQGWEHARTALRISERAALTDLNGFRIAPLVRVNFLPPELEHATREMYWYRRYRGRMVQEIRLVPSNVRIYFHGRTTVGTDAGAVFEQFGVDTPGRAYEFEVRFVRSTLALLTLFARTLRRAEGDRPYAGLDLNDVWLDKDAVLAPDGTVHFVDLEGIEEVRVAEGEVAEKLEDQIFRSLYEFVFAYEQIEAERARRFGDAGPRKPRFERIVERAVAGDPVLKVAYGPNGLTLRIGNALAEESLYRTFPLVDR